MTEFLEFLSWLWTDGALYAGRAALICIAAVLLVAAAGGIYDRRRRRRLDLGALPNHPAVRPVRPAHDQEPRHG